MEEYGRKREQFESHCKSLEMLCKKGFRNLSLKWLEAQLEFQQAENGGNMLVKWMEWFKSKNSYLTWLEQK